MLVCVQEPDGVSKLDTEILQEILSPVTVIPNLENIQIQQYEGFNKHYKVVKGDKLRTISKLRSGCQKQ